MTPMSDTDSVVHIVKVKRSDGSWEIDSVWSSRLDAMDRYEKVINTFRDNADVEAWPVSRGDVEPGRALVEAWRNLASD